MSLRYQIVLHRSEEGYAVNCPALPGCWSRNRGGSDAKYSRRYRGLSCCRKGKYAWCGRARSGSISLADAENSRRQNVSPSMRLIFAFVASHVKVEPKK